MIIGDNIVDSDTNSAVSRLEKRTLWFAGAILVFFLGLIGGAVLWLGELGGVDRAETVAIVGRNGWDRFPVEFVNSLREALGAERFNSLTALAEKYNLFDQPLFAHPESFTDIQDELTKVEVAALLTSMGNELSRRHILEDAESAFRIALTLRPEHAAARGSLAAICYSTGRVSEAKEHALKAMADMDSHKERYKDIEVPEHIADPDAVASFRSLLQSIAEGEVSD